MEEEGGDFRPWDELIPDALGLIFKSLPLHELLTVIPCVCKSWRKTVTGPYCWQEINMEDFSRRCNPTYIDRMVRMLVKRSGGSLRNLTASGLGAQDSSIFSFIADHASSLQTLRIPRSEITDSMLEQIVKRLPNLTFLDLSYCNKVGAPGLEAIGKSCNNLETLCRNMPPIGSKSLPDDEAKAIATTMPKLKRLEMAYQLMGDDSVLNILKNCPNLEFLDLRGCWNVGLEDKLLKERFPGLKVLGPMVMDHDWEDYSDFSDNSEYYAWEFDAGEVEDYGGMIEMWDDEVEDYGGLIEMWDDERGGLEEVELRFYQGFDHDDGGHYDWPASP